MGLFRLGTQSRLVNLTFDTEYVTYLAGMAAKQLSMQRGRTPWHPEGFGEGDLAGRQTGK